MPSCGHLFAAWVLLATALWPAPARAQGRPDEEARRAEARAIAEQGDAEFGAGRCDLAVPLWKRADAAFHAPTLTLRVARCQSLLGHVVDASTTLRALLEEPLSEDAPPVFVAARDSARAELPAMLERVASLRVRVEGPQAAGADVEVDGVGSPAGVELSLDPGEHHVFVRLLGATYEKSVSLGDGEKRELAVGVVLETHAPVLPVQRKIGYAIGAVGAAGVLAGGVFGVLALSSAGPLSSACGADRQHCPSGDQPGIDSLKNRALAADVALGSGVALLGAGVVVVLTSPARRTETPSVRLSASLGGLSLAGVF